VLTDQLILRLLKVRIVVDGKDIYYFEKGKPALLQLYHPNCSIIITDGFHYSKPFHINFQNKDHYRLRISSILDNGRLSFIIMLTAILFLLAFLNELSWIKFLSFIPVIVFLYFYYINRKNFFLLEAF
jgi:hypothetical protein